MVNVRRTVAWAALAALALAACAGDDTPTATVNPPTAAATATDPDAAPEPLTGTQICKRLTVAEVTADTGLDVTLAIPDDSATPQCRYEFVNSTGGVSNLTVASMRADDVGGLTATAAFDQVALTSRTVAGDGAEVQELSAGDGAARVTGASFHVGVVLVDDHVVTLIVPAENGVDTDAVDALIATMATALG